VDVIAFIDGIEAGGARGCDERWGVGGIVADNVRREVGEMKGSWVSSYGAIAFRGAA